MRAQAFFRRTDRTSQASVGALALVVFLLALAGCRATTVPGAQLSESAVRLDLPLVRQDALHDCGLASISALCQYWGIEIPAEERLVLARTAADNAGLSGHDVRTALEQLGLEVYLFQGTLDRAETGIYGHVDAGRPPLVMLSNDGEGHHYELVLGYDEPRENLILLDPMKGEVLVPAAIFDRNWARCKRFTLLACNKADEPTAPSGPDAGAPPSSNTSSQQKELNP